MLLLKSNENCDYKQNNDLIVINCLPPCTLVYQGFISYKNKREESRYHRKIEISNITAFFVEISRQNAKKVRHFENT